MWGLIDFIHIYDCDRELRVVQVMNLNLIQFIWVLVIVCVGYDFGDLFDSQLCVSSGGSKYNED